MKIRTGMEFLETIKDRLLNVKNLERDQLYRNRCILFHALAPPKALQSKKVFRGFISFKNVYFAR